MSSTPLLLPLAARRGVSRRLRVPPWSERRGWSPWPRTPGWTWWSSPPSGGQAWPPPRVLNHPTWQMGPKVTVDSATLMNKGLEVMEARWLFDIPLDRIKVVLHRESIVHSLVEFVDGSVKAQLGPPDMRLPIQYALAYPDRLDAVVEPLTLTRMGVLTFGEVEMARYPCLRLALHAARMGDSYPAALSAANEVAVTLFLSGRITFGTIPSLVEEVLSRHQPVRMDGLEAVQAVDDWAQSLCRSLTDDWRA